MRRYLGREIDSVAGLEVLLLVRRERRVWTSDEIVSELRSTSFAIRRRLEGLAHRGLIAQEGDGWRYACDAQVDAIIGELASAYEVMPLRVIDALYGRGSDAMQAFSDAFRIRDDAEGGENG